MEKHSANDQLVEIEEVVAQEKDLYDHTAAILRIFGFGKEYPEEADKIVQSMKPGFCGVAPLSGEFKDHKEGWSQAEGPPVRPLCNGNVGANAAIGHVTSMLLRPIRADLNLSQGTAICSREELLRGIADLNNVIPQKLESLKPSRPVRACKMGVCQDFQSVIVGSMDVKSLYPSCKLREASGHIRNALGLVETKYEQLDLRFTVRYLGLTVGRTNTTLDQFIPVPVGTSTRR